MRGWVNVLRMEKAFDERDDGRQALNFEAVIIITSFIGPRQARTTRRDTGLQEILRGL
jgi:hypothetical protein